MRRATDLYKGFSAPPSEASAGIGDRAPRTRIGTLIGSGPGAHGPEGVAAHPKSLRVSLRFQRGAVRLFAFVWRVIGPAREAIPEFVPGIVLVWLVSNTVPGSRLANERRHAARGLKLVVSGPVDGETSTTHLIWRDAVHGLSYGAGRPSSRPINSVALFHWQAATFELLLGIQL